MTSCTTALQLALHVTGVGPGDEVIVPSLSVHRDRQRGLALRRDAGVRRHRPAHLQPRPGGGRGRDHAAHQGDHARPPGRAAGRHGPRSSSSATATASRSSRTPRAPIGATYKGRPVGSLSPTRLLLAAPAQGDHHRRGRHDHRPRPRGRRRACACCAQHGMDVSDLARHAATDVVIESYPERGCNYRMTDMQAALGLCQLHVLDEILERRRGSPSATPPRSRDIPALHAPFDPPDASARGSPTACAWTRARRSAAPSSCAGCCADGIATRRGVMAIHQEAAYAGPRRLRPPAHRRRRGDVLMLPAVSRASATSSRTYVIERLAVHAGAIGECARVRRAGSHIGDHGGSRSAATADVARAARRRGRSLDFACGRSTSSAPWCCSSSWRRCCCRSRSRSSSTRPVRCCSASGASGDSAARRSWSRSSGPCSTAPTTTSTATTCWR